MQVPACHLGILCHHNPAFQREGPIVRNVRVEEPRSRFCGAGTLLSPESTWHDEEGLSPQGVLAALPAGCGRGVCSILPTGPQGSFPGQSGRVEPGTGHSHLGQGRASTLVG